MYMNDVDLKQLLVKVPNSPGVYKFKNKDGKILYVGKAKNLKNRVRSYFRKEKNRAMRTQKLVSKIADMEWIEVGSDLEAIMLETNLIKEYRPKYNVLMKDDKNYCYIKVTNETFPRIKIVRKVQKDGARYFGPKTSAGQVKKTLGLLQKLFMFRSCDLGMIWDDDKVQVIKKTIAYPCLDYHIKRCAGPCISEITPEDYGKNIEQIVEFLEGKTERIEERIKADMQEAVSKKKFEKAAQLRDRLLSIEDLMKKQVVTSSNLENMDVIGFVLNEGKAYFNLFQVREGKLINQENFIADAPGFLSGDEAMAPEVLERFLFDYYGKCSDIPSLVLMPCALFKESLFPGWMNQEANRKVELRIPQRGDKDKLMELAVKNAESFFKQHRARWAGFGEEEDHLKDLQEALKLEKLPKRIECYDISHLGGTDTVASMVVFENGKPKKSDYRRFKLRSIAEGEIDDFKSMNEILNRRLAHLSHSPAGLTVKKATKKSVSSLNELLTAWNGTEVEDYKDWTIALDEDKVVAALRVELSKEKMVLRSLYVAEDFRRQGVARALIKFTSKKHKIKRTYAAVQNELLDFYIKLGFEPIKSFPKDFSEALKSAKGRAGTNLIAYSPGKTHDPSFSTKPSLIVIDGGKGQLNKALKAREHYGLSIPMIGLAKREEDVFLPGQPLPVLLPKDSGGLKLLQQLRNEAHRFAITFQRSKRKKHLTQSALDDVPGLGPKNKMKLLRFFGSVEQIKKAEDSAIEKIVGSKLTQAIRASLDEPQTS